MASEEGIIAEKEEQHHQSDEFFKYSNRVVLRSILGRGDGGIGMVGERVVVGGWVKSCKEKPKMVVAVTDVMCSEGLMSRLPILRSIARLFAKGSSPPVVKPDGGPAKTVPSIALLRINDGSCFANLLMVVDSSLHPLGQIRHVGTSILVGGVIEKPLAPTKHAIELKVQKILHVGSVDPEKYPLGKARLSLDSIRSYPHLRPRTTTVASITRIRNNLSSATHLFFQNNGFLHVHMPIITTTSSRSNSKMFQVTALFSKSDDMEKVNEMNDKEAINLEVVRAAIKEKSTRIEELKRSDSNKEVLVGALQDLQKANELALQLEKQQKKATSIKAGNLDFSKDFFSQPAYLSSSFGLHLESYACALGSAYTFGPTFQADNDSQYRKHLAETWMIEVELAFAELEDVMNCAEDCLKFLCHSILENCPHDIKFLSKRIDNKCIERIKSVMSSPFMRITYTEAVEILKKATEKKFDAQFEWGINLSKEHESYLADEVFKQPVIVYEYPKEFKPFYVRIRDDERTVFAFDIIAPKAGVLVRGSQKEERIDMISTRIQEQGLPQELYEWYIDLRRHGTVKHSGFSLGFEDLVMFATGIDDIRDAIPFPRTRGSANT